MESTIVLEMICTDIDADAQKILKALGQTQEALMAVALLTAAAHILRAGDAPSARSIPPAAPAPLPPAERPDEMNIEALALQVAGKLGVSPNGPPGRSLREQWAGPLPSRKSRRVKVYPVVQPNTPCGACGDPVHFHPKDKNVPADDEGRHVYVLCGNRRVRSEVADE